MGPKIKKVENVDSSTIETIKGKRGRKSKKELMASLNIDQYAFIKEKEKDNKKPNSVQSVSHNTINLNVSEIDSNSNNNLNIENINIYDQVLVDENLDNDEIENEIDNKIIITQGNEEPKIAKKRGRKPKGGKIIQQLVTNEPQKEEKPNVILHLKCSLKDLQLNNQNNTLIGSYNFLKSNDLGYELIGNENTNSNTLNAFNDKNSTELSALETCYECDDYDDESVCKDSTKEIYKKLKQLEHNLHINNVNNKRSACFWDTCEFDNPPIYIPKHFINGTYHVYGCFCSPECGVAYLMNENIDSSTKFERYHLFNHIYTKIYNYKKNIKPSPNPFYMLEKYYGNLSIQEYRSLLRNERLFLIVDKPLTRILPELHEDNDDFILNNKIIPSNNYHIKTKLQRKKQNKSSILNEKFGSVQNTALLE
jgi:hypothetical protein